MSYTISFTPGRYLGVQERVTPAKLQAIIGSAVFSLTGTADAADIGAGAITSAKTKPGPHFYAADSGAADALVVDPSPALGSLAAGAWVWTIVNNDNATTTPTLNVNSLGAVTIKKLDGQALVAGDLQANAPALFFYDGTNWLLATPAHRPISFLSASATLDFGNTAAQNSAELTITVTGAAVGDPVYLATPAAPNANSCFTAYVSAADTVTVRFNNYSSGAIDPASGSYRVLVAKWT